MAQKEIHVEICNAITSIAYGQFSCDHCVIFSHKFPCLYLYSSYNVIPDFEFFGPYPQFKEISLYYN